LLFVLLLGAPVLAQVPGLPGSQRIELRQFLADRDIDEAELRQRLLAKGINVDGASPEELVRLRPQIEAVIAAMEAEAAQAKEEAREAAATSTEKIQEAVEDGASVEEAITDVTTEEAGEELPESNIYGHQIFRNKSLQVYRATDNATPPESYPLKEGDEIAVSIFGASQTDFILRVNESGFVQLPNTLRIPLAGVSIGDARTLLGRRLRQYYTFRNGELSIRMQLARTVSVNIFGQVETSGSYSMSSLNTGFNALIAAGGPTERGSVRKIQLNNGKDQTILDVYDFLQNPIQKTDLFIANNATIFVPVAEKIVTIGGGVQRPMKYELIEGESLKQLIAFAGEPLPEAETSNIRVTRYNRGSLEVLNVDFAQTPDFELLNGDLVEVPVIKDPIEDFVAIEGAVLLPGRYAYEEGIDVASLVTLGRLRPSARTDEAFLFRSNDDGTNRLIRVNLGADAGAEKVELQRGDRLQILNKKAFLDNANFTVEGAVRDTAITMPFPQDGALTLEEAILLAGGARPNAAPEVMIIRTPLNNQEEKIYKRLDLRQSGDFELQPKDQVIVYDQERFSDRPTVSVSGAVRAPGVYTFDPSLTVANLLYLAGGTRMDAALSRVEVFRLQITEGASTKTLLATLDLNAGIPFDLQPFDQVIVRSAAEFEQIQNIVVQGEVRYPGRYALLKDNERLSDVISRAGGLTDEAFPAGATLYRPATNIGYVVLDLDRVVTNAADPANMVIRANDTLFIPKRQDLVTIYTQGTLADRFGRDSTTLDGTIQVAYQGNKPARWYIKRYAGGFEDDIARRRWTTVEYANGQVKETKSFAGIRDYPEVLPGAAIRVPLKPEKKQKQRREERFDWIGLAQILVGAATTITTFILLRR
jgi:protein involved in polysaccharide export with SLBB domain